MLTADLVRAFRRGDELRLRALKARDRERAVDLAGRYIELARACVGRTRGELDEALQAVPLPAREHKLGLGLRKLVMDRCQLEAQADVDPVALRQQVFARAGALRRDPERHFDRAAVLAEIAGAHQRSADEIERLLYTDLRGAHRLLGFQAPGAEDLVDAYVTGQAQAVLLRAVQVRARVWSRDPGIYRALFHKLKFLRLLYRLEPHEDGYQLDIDGPYSLFRSVTKYGLQLALLLPAIQACERWSIEAEVMWGKQRTPLRFVVEGRAPRAAAETAPALPDDVAALLARFGERESPWRAAPASDILELPGVGLCVPDLVFEHADTGERVYLEVLGFWSRDAVWRRVELVQRGLPHRILFAVSSRLRVSEAVLQDELPGALYVYKGVMSARAVEERLGRLVGRA